MVPRANAILCTEITLGLLDDLPTYAIAEIVQRLNPRLYIDFIQYLPAEICLKILGCLDPISLVSVAQTCRAWYELALDRKLWERLYHLEGWKAVASEIEACEARINATLDGSIGRIRRSQNTYGQPTRVRPIGGGDEDLEMADAERRQSVVEPSWLGAGAGSSSIFGTPASSFSSNRPTAAPHAADMDVDSSFASSSGSVSKSKGKAVDRSFGSGDVVRVKRKEPGGNPEPSLPPTMTTENSTPRVRSTLWSWDANGARYRVNWKYLYNMRRRLESNWELGKFSTFQLPHPHFPEEGHQECVYTLQFDAHYLVSGSRDQTMRIWNLHTQRLARAPLIGHLGSVLCLQFDADPAEDILVSGSSDSNVFIWKFSTGEVVQRITTAHRESVLNVRFDKRILVTSSKDKTIKIFNRKQLRYGDLGYTVDDNVVNPVGQPVKHYGYEPDLSHELPVKEPFTLIGRLEGHSAAVNAIQVRDRTIVSVSGDRHIKVWDWPDQVCTQTIPAHDKGIACVEFDGRRIVSGSSDYEVCIFDAPTGLKVAQLRGHAHLVRTVQAGFGDLPFSKIEDELEARMVDAEYFRAVEAGLVTHEREQRDRRIRRANAGSSQPAEIQATGAKVPPGGGGGRKYGRIVSGSYDQSIIIWRRDKEGVWKPAHHLRQEEAAAAAQRLTARNISRHQVPPGVLPLQPPHARRPYSQPGGSRSIHSLHRTAPVNGAGVSDPATTQMPHGISTALIDQVVPQGPTALEQALTTYPQILSYQGYLQAAIEREASSLIRMHLRRVVASALAAHSMRNGHPRQRHSGPAASSATAGPARRVAPTPAALAGPSMSAASTAAATAGSATAANAPVDSAGNEDDSSSSSDAPLDEAADVDADIDADVVPQTARPAAATTATPGPATASAVPLAATPLVTGPPAIAAPFLAPAQLVPAHHHPHIAAAENAPARVFKLQFDACKIVCCSQAPVIVGWDFCNSDPELQETARFFATID